MISVINGYVCFSSCDAAAATQGKDPNAHPGSISDASNKKPSSLGARPATVLDGAPKDLANAHSATPIDASRLAGAQQKVDLLA